MPRLSTSKACKERGLQVPGHTEAEDEAARGGEEPAAERGAQVGRKMLSLQAVKAREGQAKPNELVSRQTGFSLHAGVALGASPDNTAMSGP
jgi:hypothetical protein